MSLQYFEEEIIFLSQYLFIAILCAKMSRVNKALASTTKFFFISFVRFALANVRFVKFYFLVQSYNLNQADPIKLFFFVFRSLLLNLSVYYITYRKKSLTIK